MKLLLITFFLSMNAFAYSPEATADKSCFNIGIQYLNEHLREFEKKRASLNDSYNYNLNQLGMKNAAFATQTTIFTPEFDRIYFSTMKKGADASKLFDAFHTARPNYLKKCRDLMLQAYKTCKINMEEKDAPESQKACMRNNVGKMQTIIKDLQYNAFADEENARKKEKLIWDLVEKKKPAKDIIKHINERLKYNSHQRAFLTQLLYQTVKVNHVEMIDYVMAGMNIPGNKEAVMNSFVDKNTITVMTLNNKDLKYFTALLKAGWLTDKEKQRLTEKSKDPEVLKLLK